MRNQPFGKKLLDICQKKGTQENMLLQSPWLNAIFHKVLDCQNDEDFATFFAGFLEKQAKSDLEISKRIADSLTTYNLPKYPPPKHELE